MLSDLDSTQKKVLLFAAIGLVALFVIIKLKGGSSSSTVSSGTSALDSAELQNLQSQIDQLQMSNSTNPYTGAYGGNPSGSVPYDPSVSGGVPSPSSVVPPQSQSSAPAPAGASSVPTTTVASGNPAPVAPTPQAITPPLSVHRPSYATVQTQGLSVHQMEQVAVVNPGSPIVQPQTHSYAIAKAGASGQIAGVGTSYNQAVNQAGGQWINHQWYAGSYNSQGRFITHNRSAQAGYDAAVPNNPRG